MLGQQQDNLLKGHGLMKDVAQSVLTEQELAMFMYHLKQYQQYDLPINELMPPILTLLDTPEKVCNIQSFTIVTLILHMLFL